MPVILSVTRLAQNRMDVPAAVTVISADMIRGSGVREIADIFRLVPGFQVAYVHGSYPTVGYHGMTDQHSRNMQVLIDGRSVYSPMFGGVFWADLPLAIEDIDHIEVIRGPNAASYGSNAFAGVINIMTRHSSQDEGTFVKIVGGENQTQDGLIRYGWRNKKHDSRITVAYRQDNGFDTRPDTEHVPYVRYRNDLRLNNTDTLEIQAGINGARQEDGFFADPIFKPRELTNLIHFQQIRWRRTSGYNNELSFQFYHNFRKRNESFLTDPIDFDALGDPRTAGWGNLAVPVDFNQREERYDFEFQHILAPFEKWRFVWGVNLRQDFVQSQTYFNTTDTQISRTARLFGNTEWRAKSNIVINAGTMIENSQISGVSLSPRIALNYRLLPRHALRISATQATRSPSIGEERADTQFSLRGQILEQDLLSSGGLDNEKLTSLEIGYLGSVPSLHLEWDIRVFQDQFKDLITTPFFPINFAILDNQAEDFINSANVDIEGAEIQINYNLNQYTQFIASYANLHVKDVIDPNPKDVRNLRRSVPKQSMNILAMTRLIPNLFASVQYNEVAQMLWLGDGDVIPSIRRWDLRLAYRFKTSRTENEFAFTIQNLGDDYFEFSNDNTFTRRWYLAWSMSL